MEKRTILSRYMGAIGRYIVATGRGQIHAYSHPPSSVNFDFVTNLGLKSARLIAGIYDDCLNPHESGLFVSLNRL